MTDQFVPVARVVIVGRVASSPAPERKTVNESALTEFRVDGVGLRINAWKDLADKVPAAGGFVVVEGSIRTRTYQYEGKDREATEITASSVATPGKTAAAPAAPPPPPVEVDF